MRRFRNQPKGKTPTTGRYKKVEHREDVKTEDIHSRHSRGESVNVLTSLRTQDIFPWNRPPFEVDHTGLRTIRYPMEKKKAKNKYKYKIRSYERGNRTKLAVRVLVRHLKPDWNNFVPTIDTGGCTLRNKRFLLYRRSFRNNDIFFYTILFIR